MVVTQTSYSSFRPLWRSRLAWSRAHDWKSCRRQKRLEGSNPSFSAIKTHAKGAYKTPPRVSFFMQNRGKLPFSWQFTLFVVSSSIAVGICSSLALKNLKPLTIAQKGFLHDIPIGEYLEVFADVRILSE